MLDQLASRVAAVQNNLQSSLARASSKLQLQLPPDFQSGSSSCTSEKGTASAEVELLVSQLSGKADDLYGQISDAADSLTAVRGELQQLAAEQNPHASGVAIIEGQLRDKQQELKERQNAKLQLSKQVSGAMLLCICQRQIQPKIMSVLLALVCMLVGCSTHCDTVQGMVLIFCKGMFEFSLGMQTQYVFCLWLLCVGVELATVLQHVLRIA